MSLLLEIVAEEKSRIENMIASYESELSTLPRGSLVCKKVKNHEYYYLQFREGKKTVSAYVGGKSEKTDTLQRQIDRRRQIEKMLKNLRAEYAQAVKMMGE
jgi:hypothetical protein